MKVTSSNHFFRSNLKSSLLLFCLITTAAHAKDPSWVRATSFGGSGQDFAWAIKAGPDNRQCVTGSFSSTANFAHTTLVSAGGLDIFLAKYGRSGELLWIVGAGGPDDDSGQDLAFDRAGNIYLTGSFTNTATFGSTNGATKTVTGTGITIFLAKYRPSGALVWVETGVAPFVEQNNGIGVAVDADAGTVYITGSSQENTTFSSANGTANTVPGVGTWHMFLAKYDTSGNFQWGQTNAANPNSLSYGVAVDSKDNAYVTGWLEDTTTFSSNDGNSITVTGFSPAQTTGDFPDDAFLVKYDRNGNVKWVNHIGGYKGIGSAVAASPTGEVSLVGFVGNINFGSPGEAETIATSQPPGTSINLGGGDFTNPYNQDGFIATYDAAGVLQRALRHGGSKQQVTTGIAYDLRGNLYVTGVFQGLMNQPNLFVRKYSGRRVLWTKTAVNAGVFSSNNTTAISPAVSVDSEGRVFVTGGYQGTASFGRIKLHSVGSSDIFVAELAQN
jgi:Beta-propeller repeat